MDSLTTVPVEALKPIKGIPFPAHIAFRQLLVTGPPGAGKSTLICKLGGWSEEGYIDLSQDRWWTAQSLSLRPREIHLGFPFKGHDQAFAVFDRAWIETSPALELDLERIRIPPEKRHFFSVNWHDKYVFEFLLPPDELLYQRRLKRSRRGTHPVDVELEPGLVARQVETYRRVAFYLHQQGLHVYIREDIDQPPLQIINAKR